MTASEMRAHDRANIEAALQACSGKVFGPGGAAEMLDIKPTTLASRIKALGIANARGLGWLIRACTRKRQLPTAKRKSPGLIVIGGLCDPKRTYGTTADCKNGSIYVGARQYRFIARLAILNGQPQTIQKSETKP